MRKFTNDDEWIMTEGASEGDALIGTVGISDFAQSQLGDIVFLELPAIGKECKKGDAVAVVESVKAASDIYAPVSGVITEVNAALLENPALVNTDPLTSGWFFRLRLAHPEELDGLRDQPRDQL